MQISRLIQGSHYSSQPWAKIAQAKRHLHKLERIVDDWNSRHPIIPQQRVLDDGYTIEFWWDDPRRPPLDRWQVEASGVFQNLRDALERLNFELSMSSGHAFKERQIAFPMTDSQEAWEAWLKRNRHHRSLVIDRYLAVQPFRPGNPPTLSVLREVNDAEKHREGMRLHSSFGSSFAAGDFTVEGLISEMGGIDAVVEPEYLAINPDDAHPVLMRLHSKAKVLSVGAPGGYVRVVPEIQAGQHPPVILSVIPEFISYTEAVLRTVTGE